VPHYKNELDVEVGVILNQLFFELDAAHVAVVQFKAVLPDRGVGWFLERNLLHSSVVQKLSDNISNTNVMVE